MRKTDARQLDHQTLEDNTVTLRHRDSMKQDRIAIDSLPAIIETGVSMKQVLI